MVGVTITKHENESTGEYHAHVADNDAIGRLTWTERNGVRYAEHTLVPPVIGGRGVAGRLVEAMVADARENDFKIESVCSYVVAAFKRHPEWADVKA
ncbi:GNAT family N-acetyltransferase [Novosphingobium mangrovi (ex Huang et al. 2023)]|uniref:N-acetyltransferase n=1 Tax=Novosphingobium mangrovi (ex Huang et al. 2023) TaxID=2976432 RepID=A0ABT2I185_9SPHN|nr:GNAT family N-acetyltransferase [Novosphingobium mangrovi (ex Huang et al. 2023)]MCT2398559.1 N-acetyltransferase [Novosphingobium mangrovi (ex Huang et al. 2023)]